MLSFILVVCSIRHTPKKDLRLARLTILFFDFDLCALSNRISDALGLFSSAKIVVYSFSGLRSKREKYKFVFVKCFRGKLSAQHYHHKMILCNIIESTIFSMLILANELTLFKHRRSDYISYIFNYLAA